LSALFEKELICKKDSVARILCKGKAKMRDCFDLWRVSSSILQVQLLFTIR